MGFGLMRVDGRFLKVFHEQQLEMIEILELFEEVLLNADFRSKGRPGHPEIDGMFRQVKNLIDRHLSFESEYLLPLLTRQRGSLAAQRLLKQRNVIISLIAKMGGLMLSSKNMESSVCVWDEFIDTALSLVRATFSLFHWEEVEFLPRLSEC